MLKTSWKRSPRKHHENIKQQHGFKPERSWETQLIIAIYKLASWGMASREQIRFSPSRLLQGIWQNDQWETFTETGVLWNEWSRHQLGPIMSDTRLHHWEKIVTNGQLLNDFIKALQMINIIHISNDQTLYLEKGQHLPICIIVFHS